MIRSRLIGTLTAVVLAASAAPWPACAGPPFATDDPVPVDPGHWEVYGFSTRVDGDEDRTGTLAGVEINYGAAPNLQLHLIAPLTFDDPKGGPFKTGPGDLELGAKYRLLNASPATGGWQAAVFPLLEVPTGKCQEGLGDGHLRAFLPLWIQRDFGAWTTYGGGGYWINPGVGNRDYWFAGWLLQRRVAPRLSVAGELFYQTADETDGRDSAGFNLGLIYDITARYHLLISAGRGLQNARSNAFSYYVGLQSTF